MLGPRNVQYAPKTALIEGVDQQTYRQTDRQTVVEKTNMMSDD